MITRTLTGLVLLPDGTPAAGLPVAIWPNLPGGGTPMPDPAVLLPWPVHTETDELGAFDAELATNDQGLVQGWTYTIEWHTGGSTAHRALFALPAGDSTPVALADVLAVETSTGALVTKGDPGETGDQGPAGPTAVSADPGNAAELGSDNLLFVGGGAIATEIEAYLDANPLTAADVAAVPAHSLYDHGLDAETTDITPLISAAVAAGARRITIPYRAEAWPLTTRLDASDVWLDFEPGARISFNIDARAMDLTRVRLTNASFTSPYPGPSSAVDNNAAGHYVSFAREVRLNDGCVVEGYYHENASGGINITAGSDISIRDASFANIRHYKGWGAAIHIAGTSAYNIRIQGVTITSSDRGIEVEAGARDVWAEGGHQTAVYPAGYTGQPGDYATYTFVLDAHSHDGESFCSNIVYRDWLLEGCGGGITFIRSTGTQGADHPRNCVAEDIRILGNVMTTGYEMVAVQGYSNRVRQVHMMAGAGLTAKMRVRVYGGYSESNRIEGLRAEAYALPLIQVDDAAAGTVIDGVRPAAPTTGTGYLIDIAGRYTDISDANLFSVTGTTGYVRFRATADYSRVVDLNYNMAAGETFAAAVLIDGAEHVQVSGIQGSNYATVPPYDVQISGAARYANVQRNNIDRSAGVSIILGVSTSRCLVTGNVLSTSTATISNGGTDNTVARNLRGNVYDNAPASHAHAQSDVTGLATALAGKADTGHLHTGVYAPVLGADDNYVTDAEKAALHAHSNKTALDAVSGTNTGDQDLSGLVAKSLVDAKGDLIVATAAGTVARLPVGATTGHVLTVDPAESTGLKWAAGGGGGGATIVPSADIFTPPPGLGCGPETAHSINGSDGPAYYHFYGPTWKAETSFRITAARVVVITALASNTLRLGLVEMNSADQPVALAGDWGTVGGDTTGNKDVTGLTTDVQAGKWYATVLVRYGGGGTLNVRAWPVPYGHMGQDTSVPNRVILSRNVLSNDSGPSTGLSNPPSNWTTRVPAGVNGAPGPLEFIFIKRQEIT